MNPQDALRALAAGMRCGDPEAPHRDREAVEAHLVPLIRCALRSGRGGSGLVRWVRQNLPRVTAADDPGQPVDPDAAAPPMARLLCATLVRQLQTQPSPVRGALETVRGP